jgi:hypothetical protein
MPVAVAVQPAALVPVTVKVVVAPAVKVGLAPVEALNPVDGFHVYVAAPEAVMETVPVEQTEGLETLTVGFGLTVTVPVAVAVQPAALVPVTV